jgi:pyruvate dehydrogenase E1 component
VDGKGVSSYPHPWLMPDYWQFPTVSMGLGPIQAIYMARYLKYLQARGHAQTENRKVWVFCGDGEMDEPESLGAIGMAAREKLDNLIFIVNCNLQRLDGPVRGNGKIIQELEGEFRGSGWNVIKLIWGGYWDALLARDKEGHLRKIMEDTVDGEYQNFKANDGAFVRKHFFGKHPEVLEMVSRMSDEDIWRLNRGGHDPHKIYAAYAAAVKHKGQPTVILAKTIKGYGMGKQGQAKNPTHQLKKVDIATISEMRDRFNIPIPDDQLEKLPFYVPPGRFTRDEIPEGAAPGAGRIFPATPAEGRSSADGARDRGIRAGAERARARGREIFDHHGVRAPADRAGARQGARQARRADRAGRGAHLRHGGHVPPARHLCARGARSTNRSTRTR